MQKIQLKKLGILSGILLFLVVVLVLLLQYVSSFTKIDVQISNTGSVTLYKVNTQSAEFPNIEDYENSKPVLIVTESGKYKIRNGMYAYFSQPTSNDFDTESGILNTNEEQNITINPSLTIEKLKSIYDIEKNSILGALNNQYPSQMKNYTLEYGAVYLNGDWFAGYLVPKDGSDALQVVLHKDNNNWLMAAKPNITISSAQYPDIPKEVTTGVNIRPF